MLRVVVGCRIFSIRSQFRVQKCHVTFSWKSVQHCCVSTFNVSTTTCEMRSTPLNNGDGLKIHWYSSVFLLSQGFLFLSLLIKSFSYIQFLGFVYTTTTNDASPHVKWHTSHQTHHNTQRAWTVTTTTNRRRVLWQGWGDEQWQQRKYVFFFFLILHTNDHLQLCYVYNNKATQHPFKPTGYVTCITKAQTTVS